MALAEAYAAYITSGELPGTVASRVVTFRDVTSGKQAVAESEPGTVLLVEDEPSLRAIIQEILEAAGYSVLSAADAAAARLLAEYAGTIDLLITDVGMPGTGRELARELMALRTGMKVLYMSGHTDDPVTAGSLLRKVREVLEG